MVHDGRRVVDQPPPALPRPRTHRHFPVNLRTDPEEVERERERLLPEGHIHTLQDRHLSRQPLPEVVVAYHLPPAADPPDVGSERLPLLVRLVNDVPAASPSYPGIGE